MQDFSFKKPDSLDAAVAALEAQEDGIYLAGGQTILPVMKFGLAEPTGVVDLSGIADLVKIEVTDKVVSIGAMTTHAAVAASVDIRRALPGLADLAGLIGDPQVRNRGTLGGSIANNDPSADYPAAVLALNATVVTNRREITADDFFVDMFETALEDGEIITRVDFPITDCAAYAKFANPASRYAVAGVFVAKRNAKTDGGVRVAVTGAGPVVFRVPDMEAALDGDFSPDAIKNISVPADGLNNDIHASAEYRSHLIGVMAERAIKTAKETNNKGGGAQ
ncbi:MAG: xanthine dehydrogenase family protein subunit M [Rhodospirillales bacterium]|nr:xanthine dehydrogenase family protein subunit M [Alphaproteobacteria bacterium]MBL6948738.1 xanthine dehydrogenase family protein subunit M [Rhodospirillales bacterium]